MSKFKVNHVAVWVLVVIDMIIPAIWYSPLLFADTWMQLNGTTPADFANVNVTIYIVPFIGFVVLNYLLAWLFSKMQIRSITEGVKTAVYFWLGFYFLHLATQYLFSMRQPLLILIDGGLYFILFALSGWLLAAWEKRGTITA